MPKFATAAVVLLCLARTAAAQDVTVTLSVEKTGVVIGEDVNAEVTVTNATDKTLDLAELLLEDRSLSFEISFEAAPGKPKTFTFSALRPDPHAAERLAPARLALKGRKSLATVIRIPALRAGTLTLTAIYKGGEKEAKSPPLGLKVAAGADGAGRLAALVSTSQGDFQIDLLPEEAPLGVSHFVTLARRGFYNGMNVQMIVKNAWFKTGCPYDNGFGHPGYAYKSEAETQTVAHEAGTVALCQNLKSGYAGSQFFVNAVRQQAFDKKFTVIGRIAKLETVVKIAGLETDKGTDRPLKDDIRIKEIKIIGVK